MGRRNSSKYYLCLNLMIVVSLLMLSHHVMGQVTNLYTCWGGCYNKCFLLGSPGGRAGGVRGGSAGQYPCYFRCLSDCTFTQSSTENFQYYCQVGCSATRCIPLGQSSSDAAMEKCVRGCDQTCKI